jgi:DNA gyrase subunit A
METSPEIKISNDHGVKPVLIEQELQESFLDYAMSVVISRAIPDVRDGLKPVHRRVLYAMHELGFFYNRSYHKSVRVVGEVLGKYHPHGDSAVYNTMVGMVQDFSRRYPLLDGQGNWGSNDGDNAAAMRYTEVRMQRIAQELLADLDKETVQFVPNFDETTTLPALLPSKLPHLLMNGTSGIAVGMATSIPPHNLNEIINGACALLDDDTLTDEQLFSYIPGPDFPTGGIICGRSGILKAYQTGRGSIMVRGVVTIEENKKGTSSIIITELPYQVIKADLAIKIADLVKNKVIEGITNIRDESDKRGNRLVIDVARSAIPQVVLNLLYKHTALQSSFAIYMLALHDNRPLIFTLRQLLQEFLMHRQDVIHKRSIFDLKRASARDHLLTGFLLVLSRIEEVIALIKKSENPDDAHEILMRELLLSAEQAKAILEMRLQRLTGLEQNKIKQEKDEIAQQILFLRGIIEDKQKLRVVLKDELQELKKQYGDARRTKIEDASDDLCACDLIPDEDVVVTLTRKGYIKRVSLSTYSVQHRGGRGKMALASLDDSDDLVQDIFAAKNHDELLFFTNMGRVYSMPVYEVTEGSRTAKGRAVINLLPLVEHEQVVKLLCARDLEHGFIVMVTKQGTIKRTAGSAFAKIRSTGIRAISLDEGDELAFCKMSSGDDSVVLATRFGFGIRFLETEVRSMGRQAAGVIGIRCKKDDAVVGMEVVSEKNDLLFSTQYGYGKRVAVKDFRLAHRGGQGVRTIPTDKRNGEVIGLVVVDGSTDILLIQASGKIIRLSSAEVRTMGRQAKGVRLTRLEGTQRLVAIVACGTGDDEQTIQAAAPLSTMHIDKNQEPVLLNIQDKEPEDNLEIENIDESVDHVDEES